LAGTLSKGRGGEELLVPPVADLTRHYCEVSIPDLRHDRAITEMYPLLHEHMVKDGIHDKQLFKVTVIRTSSLHFAMFVSMSHVVADGDTFYQVCGMIGVNGVVTSLEAKRDGVDYSMESLRSVFGEEKVRGMFSFATVFGQFIWPSLFAPAPQFEVRFANLDWVAEQKKLYNCDMQHVSTNDVLTSWFLNSGDYTWGLMAVNLRGRVPSLLPSLAGNYEFSLHYLPKQFATPLGIRKPLNNKQGLRTSVLEYGTLFQRLWTKPGYVTNWASLHQDIELSGCKQLIHVPIMPLPNMYGGVLVIFKATKEKLGMYLFGHSSVVEPCLTSEAVDKFCI